MSLITKAPTLLVSESSNLATRINTGGTGYLSILSSINTVLANISFNASVPLGTPDAVTGVTTTGGILSGSAIASGIADTYRVYSGAGNELLRGTVGADYIFTADSVADIITAVGNNFIVGDAVLPSSNTTLPAPLLSTTAYFVISAGNNIQVSLINGGSVINLTDNGSGIHKIRKSSISLILNSGNTNPLQVNSGQVVSISSFSYDPEG